MGQPVFSGAFLACILVMFSDILGTFFVEPVSVQYGLSLGVSLDVVAAFSTVRYSCNLMAMFWMPACADRFGKRPLLLISLLGSALGYMLQGLAGSMSAGGIGLMLAGSAVAGLFSGTKPVLENVVTLISMPDEELVRTRLTILSSAEMSMGVALAPTAGALAQLSLNLPWLVSAAATALIFFITLCIFKEPRLLSGAASGPATMEREQAASSPLTDKYLLTLTFALFCFGVCVSGDILVLPTLLSLGPFGFASTDLERQHKSVAVATSVAGIPMGVAQLLFSTLVFLALSRRVGDVKTLVVGGALMVCSYVVHGCTAALWQVALLQALMGCGLGLLLPCFTPVIARWAMHRFPNQGAQASAVPFMGWLGGMMAGPPIMSSLIGSGNRGRVAITYMACAGCSVVGTTVMAIAAHLILRATAANKSDLAPEMMREARATNAMPAELWIEDMCERLRTYLTKGNPEYRGITAWHGWDQRYWARILDHAFPRLPSLPEKALDLESQELSAYMSAVLRIWWPVMTEAERQEARAFADQLPGCMLPDALPLATRHAPIAVLRPDVERSGRREGSSPVMRCSI